MQHSRFHPTTTIISLMVLGLIFLNFKASNRKTSIGKQSYTGQLEPVRDTVQTLLDRGEIPSMAIGVIKDGALLWREAFGWADIEAGIEATPATIYGLGSMSKSICATGVMTREKYIQIFEPPYKPTDALKGSWQGKVHVGGEHLPITMQFDTTDTIRVRMGKEPEQVLRDATFSSHFGVLMGNMDSKSKGEFFLRRLHGAA